MLLIYARQVGFLVSAICLAVALYGVLASLYLSLAQGRHSPEVIYSIVNRPVHLLSSAIATFLLFERTRLNPIVYLVALVIGGPSAWRQLIIAIPDAEVSTP